MSSRANEIVDACERLERRVVARVRSSLDVNGPRGVEDGVESGLEDREDDGLAGECAKVANKGGEIFGCLRGMWTRLKVFIVMMVGYVGGSRMCVQSRCTGLKQLYERVDWMVDE